MTIDAETRVELKVVALLTVIVMVVVIPLVPFGTIAIVRDDAEGSGMGVGMEFSRNLGKVYLFLLPRLLILEIFPLLLLISIIVTLILVRPAPVQHEDELLFIPPHRVG